jgi:hypothetical protein
VTDIHGDLKKCGFAIQETVQFTDIVVRHWSDIAGSIFDLWYENFVLEMNQADHCDSLAQDYQESGIKDQSVKMIRSSYPERVPSKTLHMRMKTFDLEMVLKLNS